MRKHRCGGVKVALFPGMSKVSRSIHSFSIVFVVFTLCLPCYSCKRMFKRGATFTASCLTHS